MNKKEESKMKTNSTTNLFALVTNPIVMGLGFITMLPEVIPVLIGGFIGYVISKSKGDNNEE